uniref:DNA-methyltransferase n=1 Tax=uncultured marine virus TaxID=186617 RepID=A0A0F7L5D0_9VIRU|nr:DNA-methyltransferase [uncultured marine virus]
MESVLDLKALDHPLSNMPSIPYLNSDQTFLSGRMLKECSPQTMAQTFGRLSKPLPTLGVIDLNGNCLIQHGFYPKIESGFTLSDILQKEVPETYFLSEKAMEGVMKGQSSPQMLDVCKGEDTQEDTTQV